MAAVRTYGIPHTIEVREIFVFNGGQGKLPIRFTGGITDPKFNIPATYSTANKFEQMVIEGSRQFNSKVFRYGPNGEIIAGESNLLKPETPAPVGRPPKERKAPTTKQQTASEAISESSTYPYVETIGQATEQLLELGVRADELNGKEAVLSAMLRMKVSFPNLKFDE